MQCNPHTHLLPSSAQIGGVYHRCSTCGNPVLDRTSCGMNPIHHECRLPGPCHAAGGPGPHLTMRQNLTCEFTGDLIHINLPPWQRPSVADDKAATWTLQACSQSVAYKRAHCSGWRLPEGHGRDHRVQLLSDRQLLQRVGATQSHTVSQAPSRARRRRLKHLRRRTLQVTGACGDSEVDDSTICQRSVSDGRVPWVEVSSATSSSIRSGSSRPGWSTSPCSSASPLPC